MRASSIREVRKGYGWGILSGMTWGLDTVLIGLLMGAAPFSSSPVLLASGVFVCCLFHDGFAAFWLWLLMGARGRLGAVWRGLRTRDGAFCVLGALLGGPVGMSFYLLAIRYAGPAYTAVVTSCYPALSVGLAWLLLGERQSWLNLAGIGVCVCGIVWLGYLPGGEAPEHFLTGILCAAGSALGWALESVVCAYGMRSGRVDPACALSIREMASFVTYGAVVTPLFCGGYGGVGEVLANGPVAALAVAALVGVVSYLFWYKSIDMIGVSKGISLNVTYSFWAIVFALLLAGGSFSLQTLVCCFLIIGGVMLAVGRPACAAGEGNAYGTIKE